MSKYTEEAEEVQFSEPILAQKGVKLKVGFAEHTEWEVKNKPSWSPEQKITMQDSIGNKFDACKLTLHIDDSSVRCEHEDAKPRGIIEDQFNIESYPYPDKKTGKLKKLGRSKLYQLEEAFGFDPIFKVKGDVVEPKITRSGRKIAPKVEGVKRSINPDFFNAYFTEKGRPLMENWEAKTIYADVGVVENTQYGDKNVIDRYVSAPVI